jgi:SAM-dependent methyltransferase
VKNRSAIRDLKIRAAKALMNLSPQEGEESLSAADVRYIREFRDADPPTRRSIMLEMAQTRYDTARLVPYASYFGPHDITGWLAGLDVLDFGCSNGGLARAVYESYNPASITGLDIDIDRIDSAKAYFDDVALPGRFVAYEGLEIPFGDESFDTAYCFDVFEHIPDLACSLRELHRVLRPGGHILAVFPGYYHPKEHHLFLATRTPFVHYLFGRQVLGLAYQELLDERGDRAAWYRRDLPAFLPWERSFMINGMSKRRFRALARRTGFEIELDYPLTLGETGKIRRRHPIVGLPVPIFKLAARVPVLEEAFTHRIVMALKKPDSTERSRLDGGRPAGRMGKASENNS